LIFPGRIKTKTHYHPGPVVDRGPYVFSTIEIVSLSITHSAYLARTQTHSTSRTELRRTRPLLRNRMHLASHAILCQCIARRTHGGIPSARRRPREFPPPRLVRDARSRARAGRRRQQSLSRVPVRQTLEMRHPPKFPATQPPRALAGIFLRPHAAPRRFTISNRVVHLAKSSKKGPLRRSS